MDDIDADVTIYEIVKDGVWLDEEGSFKTSFDVPDELDDGTAIRDVTSGTYYVYVCHYLSSTPPTIQARIRAVATFTVTRSEITLSPSRGPTGTLVEVTGNGFPSREDLTFKYDELSIPIESSSKRTGNAGDFISVIHIPDSTAGEHIITALVSGTETTAQFRVKPEITISPTSGATNTRVSVKGTGFGDRTQVDIWFYNIKVATATTSSQGSFSKSFNVPNLEAGVYAVDAEGEANVVKSRFTVTALPAAISISASSGSIGKSLVITGAGFGANTIIIVKYDDDTVATTSTDSNGVFTSAFAVPTSKYGQHTIGATDGTRVKELTFTVESVPPPMPTPLQPEMGAKVQPPISFDWTDVTDDSQPVIYSLQIATSKDFSTASILLEKRELSTSAYTLTAEDMTKLDVGKPPYHWRVRAVDGASNEGYWTYGGTFQPATAFPSWAVYAIIALGVLFLIGIGILLSMKIGFLRRKDTTGQFLP